MTMKAAPRRVLSAQNSYREAFGHFILLEFNFPFEASMCIPQLRGTLEWLLREHLRLPKKSYAPMKELTNGYGKFNINEDEFLRWLTDKRNEIMHKGEVQWEEYAVVERKLLDNFKLIGRLFEELDYTLSDFLNPWEVNLSKGIKLELVDQAQALSSAAVKYCEVEPDIAIDISNKALELSLRGFARGWNFSGHDELTIDEIMDTMRDFEDDRAAYYEDRRIDDETRFKHLKGDWFKPLMTVSDLVRVGSSNLGWTYPQSAIFYTQEIAEVVASLVERTPLHVEMCIKSKWHDIIGSLQEKIPDVEIPEVDFNGWEHTHFYNNHITVRILNEYKIPEWAPVEVQTFLEIISTKCGEIQDEVIVEFQHGIEWI